MSTEHEAENREEQKEQVAAQLVEQSQVLLEEKARLNCLQEVELKAVGSSLKSGDRAVPQVETELCRKCRFRSAHDFWAHEETEAKQQQSDPTLDSGSKKKVGELHRSLVDCKYELEAERSLREKAQAQLSHMQLKFDDLAERIHEALSK